MNIAAPRAFGTRRSWAGAWVRCYVCRDGRRWRRRCTLCYQKMSSARMSRGETLVLVMQPARDRPTHDLALAPGR